MSEASDMPRKPPSYICHDRGMVYFRVRGVCKIRMREPEGSPEFHRRKAELLERLRNGQLKARPVGAPKPGTWRWLCVQYFESSTGVLALEPVTRKARRLELEGTFDEPIGPDDPVRFGDLVLQEFTPKAVAVLRDRKKHAPNSANSIVKAIRRVFSWALKPENAVAKVNHNPARDVTKLRSKRAGGWHTWTEQEIEQFQARHPLGTTAHLAMTVLLYSGGRLGDAYRLGRQHIRNGRLQYTQEKNHRTKPVMVDITIPADLQQAIDAIQRDLGPLIVGERGQPFTSKDSFRNWFRARCNEAGLRHCSAHGLRKAAAVRLAHNRATSEQAKKIMGWRQATCSAVTQSKRTERSSGAIG